MSGTAHLELVVCRDRKTGAFLEHAVSNVFVMIGAVPNTEWRRECLRLDEKGFVFTGSKEDGSPTRSPYATSKPGVFAVGDVRAGSVKRVASSVGEGSVVIQAVHSHLLAVEVAAS
jgi:thioredoxin reductase (NADPH)